MLLGLDEGPGDIGTHQEARAANGDLDLKAEARPGAEVDGVGINEARPAIGRGVLALGG